MSSKKAHPAAALLQPFLYAYMRHFPIQRGKLRLLDSLGYSFWPTETTRQTTLKFANIKMACDLSRFIQRRLYFLGDYEPEQVALWMKLAAQANVIMDVGANVGVYSLAAAAANPAALIHAFEPTPELTARLQTNIALNQFDRIVVNSAAVGQQAGEIYLHYGGGKGGMNEGMNYVSPTAAGGRDRLVPVVSLDEFCEQNKIETVDLMKIDIEGHEYHALRGAENLLSQNRIRCIFMELNSWAVERSGHALSDIIDLLHDFAYQFYEIRHGSLVQISDKTLLVDRDVVLLPKLTQAAFDYVIATGSY